MDERDAEPVGYQRHGVIIAAYIKNSRFLLHTTSVQFTMSFGTHEPNSQNLLV